MCMFNSKLTYACAVSLLIDWSIFQVNLVIMTPGQCMKHMCLNSVLYPTRSVKCSPFLMLYWLCNQAVLVVNIGTCDVVLFSCLTAVITWILVFVICWWHVWKKKKKKKKKKNTTCMFTVMHGNESVQCYLETYSVLIYRILQI